MEVVIAILKTIGAFAVGFAAIYVVAIAFELLRRRKEEKGSAEKRGPSSKQRKVWRPHINKMDIILLAISVALVTFTIKMIEIYEAMGSVPDTLVVSVFTAAGGECGAMSWIKTSKERKQERKWQLEDEQRLRYNSDKSNAGDYGSSSDT